ncbi:MAG: hypothetical protein KDB66_01725 [Solirubrobacterales bacterium]|nr:hypothetical protein [Solirubrobacterales bacterium]MCB8915152.1 hypothetical protein [Thermoleophilales bacterium]
MAEEPAKKNRDGSKIGSDEYVTLALCIIVPIIGLLFAFYYRQQGEKWAGRAIVVGLIALFVWLCLVFVL